MKKNRLVLPLFFSMLLLALVLACNNRETTPVYQPAFVSDTSNQNTIVIGFPSFSYSQAMGPTIEYINAHLRGTRLKAHACVSWEEFLSLLGQRKFDLSIVNGLVACTAGGNGYEIRGKISSDEPNASLIITRRSSHINKVSDLKGKKIAIVPSNLIPASMMGKYYLYTNGLDVNTNIHTEKVASFEAAIISAYLGKSDAAICPARNWNIYLRDHPDVLSKVEVKWRTPPFEHNAILVNKKLDKKITASLLNILFSMSTKSEARSALNNASIDGFEKADSTMYRSLQEFKRKYDSVIF